MMFSCHGERYRRYSWIFVNIDDIFMLGRKILMIFSLSHALLPKPLLCLAKRSGYPGSWPGTNSPFPKDPQPFNAWPEEIK